MSIVDEARAAELENRYTVGLFGRLSNQIEALEAAVIDALSSLVAAVSLLERGEKKAAPSDKMFAQMLIDYNSAIERTQDVLTQEVIK